MNHLTGIESLLLASLLAAAMIVVGPEPGRAAVVQVQIYGVQGGDSRGHAQGEPFDTSNPICTGAATCAYNPSTAELHVGDSLDFVNLGEHKHTATGDLDFSPQLKLTVQPSTTSNSFSTGKLAPDGWRRIGPFGLQGTMDYYCLVHGPDQMRGRLSIAQSPTTTTTTSSTTTTTTTTTAGSTTTTTAPLPLHDIVVRFAESQPSFTVGEIVQVKVVVTNVGTVSEAVRLTLTGDINYHSSRNLDISAGDSVLATFDYPVPVRLQVTLTATGELAAGLADVTPGNNSETKTYSTTLTGATSRTFDVSVTNSSPWFSPTRLGVVIGDTVRWTNLSAGTHTVTSLLLASPSVAETDAEARLSGLEIGGHFDRRGLLPGDTFSVLFDAPGTYPYICFIHPYMAGNVTVGLPGLPITAGPVPDVLQGTNTPFGGLPSNNGFSPGVGEVCATGGFEKPSAVLPSGVVHCLDAQSFRDLSLEAFDLNPTASIRTLGAADTTTPDLIGRKIGGRFEGIENAHNIWYDKSGQKMFVTEWHGSNFWTINRMTNAVMAVTPVFAGADVTHVMTTLPGEAAGVLTLEGGPEGHVGIFDPVTSAMTQLHSFGAVHHPHGPWISCPGGGNGGGIMVVPFPMSNTIGFTNLPATPGGPVTDRVMTASPGLYPAATGALSDCTKAYTSNAVSGTVTVSDIQSGAVLRMIELPVCPHCTLMGVDLPQWQVPVQLPASPDNRYIVVAMGKASQVAIIDTITDTVVTVVDCGSGCHGVNMGAKKGGGFYAWVSMQYQDKLSVIDLDSLVKAGDVPVNVRSILTLQGLTPLSQPSALSIAEGTWGGMGVGPFPLPPPWHLGIRVVD